MKYWDCELDQCNSWEEHQEHRKWRDDQHEDWINKTFEFFREDWKTLNWIESNIDFQVDDKDPYLRYAVLKIPYRDVYWRGIREIIKKYRKEGKTLPKKNCVDTLLHPKFIWGTDK